VCRGTDAGGRFANRLFAEREYTRVPLLSLLGGAAPSVSARRQGSHATPLPHLPRVSPATSAPGLGSALPHPHRDWAHPCHIWTRTRWAHPWHIGTGTGAHPCHICTGTRLTPATSATGLGSPLPHRHRDWAHRSHIDTGTGAHIGPGGHEAVCAASDSAGVQEHDALEPAPGHAG
jgi:hypothetical protein